jgi:hypothetical protein
LTDKREIFYATIKFDNPFEAIVTIAARDEAHARELVLKQFDQRKNLEIVDVFADGALPEGFGGTKVEDAQVQEQTPPKNAN